MTERTPRARATALSARRQAFVREYLIDLNAAQAAVRAGYSARTARAQGARLLTNVDIAAAILSAMQARTERTQVTADRVIEELAVVAFSDLRNYRMGSDDPLSLRLDSRSDAARAVSRIKRTRVRTRYKKNGRWVSETTDTVELRLWDKVSALRALMPHLGLTTERTESRDLTIEALIAEDDELERSADVSRGTAQQVIDEP